MTIITQVGYVPGDTPAGVPLIGYENRITAVVASSAALPASNLLNPATHLIWRATNILDQTLTLTISGTVNYLAIAKHNFFETGAHVAIGTTASPPNLIPGFVPIDASPMIFRLSPVAGPLIISINGASTPAQAAAVYAGNILVLERGVKMETGHKDIVHARQSNVLAGMSESGNFLGRLLVSQWRESVAEFAWFTPTWYRANFEPFVTAAQTAPFFWAWNPSEYPAETAYAWITEDVVPETDPATRRMAATLSMRAVV